MRIVLDASVAIASERPHEPGYAAARARIVRVLRGEDEIVVPPVFSAEVAGALGRRGHDHAKIRDYVAALTAPPHHVRTFGPRAARRVADHALRCRLRGADSGYAWLASVYEVPLCTLDNELAARAAALCDVMAP